MRRKVGKKPWENQKVAEERIIRMRSDAPIDLSRFPKHELEQMLYAARAEAEKWATTVEGMHWRRVYRKIEDELKKRG